MNGPVLITGGTGCVGSNLAAELTSRGIRCRAVVRPGSDTRGLDGVDVERVNADVLDPASLRAAMRDCGLVFHTAAVVSFWKKERARMFEVNVTGTRNVLQAAEASGVQRVVHTSSIAALGYRTDGGLIDEQTAYNWGESNGYKYSKHLAEMEVVAACERGQDAVIVNPTVVIGARDVYSHGGRFILSMLKGGIPAYLNGGLNVVAVRDVIQGHLLAAEAGKSGERYLLGGRNFTHKAFFEMLGRILDRRPPSLRAPVGLVKTAAWLIEALSDLTGREPWLSPDLVSGAGMFNWHSIAKAEQELGYKPTAIEDAVQEAAAWYKLHGIS